MTENERATALAVLQFNNVRYIKADYCGSGDSGDVERVYIEDDDKDELEFPSDELETFCCDLVDNILMRNYSYDWYNNDGGQGTVIIDLHEQTWTVDGTINFVAKEDASDSGTIDLNSFD